MAHEFIAVHLDLFSHPKFLHLARLVGSPEEAAYRLILMWQWTARHRPDGVLNEVAAMGLKEAIEPPDSNGVLMLALNVSGFIETIRGEEHKLVEMRVHGWDEWQPFWSARRRMSEAGRAGAAKRWGVNGVAMATPSAPHVGIQIAPPMASEIESEREKELTTLVIPAKKRPDDRQWREWFDNFWFVYPRKVAKRDALKAWGAHRPKNPAEERHKASMIRTALDRFLAEEWAGRPPDKIPYPATWLRRESFAEADVLEGEP